MVPPSIALLATGTKALHFLSEFDRRVDAVFTYPTEELDHSVAAFRSLADARDFELIIGARPSLEALSRFDLAFAIGWQYLIVPWPDGLVVFHDSLVPKYRGFAPTVNALISGEPRIGVSALLPGDSADCGRVLAQAPVEVEYPCTIARAFELIAPLYRKCAYEVIDAWPHHRSMGFEQDDELASYSIWRDEHDYFIDWSWSASRICRFVDAVGSPYRGARTSVGDAPLRVHKTSPVPDVNFVDRQPGKVWAKDQDGRPTVVCGSGMVRIDDLSTLEGDEFSVTSLRTRFS